MKTTDDTRDSVAAAIGRAERLASFATAALVGLLAVNGNDVDATEIAANAFIVADAMLAESDRRSA